MTDRLLGLALLPAWCACTAGTAIAVGPLLAVAELSRRWGR